jgi:hypothetical protein
MIKLTELLSEGETQFTKEEADLILDKYIKIMHGPMEKVLAVAKKSGYTGISKLSAINPGPHFGNGRNIEDPANTTGESKKYPPVFPGNSPIMFTATCYSGINITKFGQLELRGINLMANHIPGKKAKISQTIKKVFTLDKLESELKSWVPKFVSDAKAYAKVLSVPPEDPMNASDQIKRMFAKRK